MKMRKKKWKLTAPSEIKLEKCQPWPAGKDGEGNEQQWGYCTWLTKDDMEEITAQMHKPGYLRGPAGAGDLERVAWIPTEAEVNLCRATPTPH